MKIRITKNYMSLTTDVFNLDGDILFQYALGTDIEEILTALAAEFDVEEIEVVK